VFESSQSLKQILDGRTGPPTIREQNGELCWYTFQQWRSFKELESGWSPDTSQQTTLYFGLGSRDRARKLIQSGAGQRLYEPDPHRFNRFHERYPDVLRKNDWKVGTGLWLEEGFLNGAMNLELHPLLKRAYDPLPSFLATGNPRLLEERGIVMHIGELYYRDLIESFKQFERRVWPLKLGHWDSKMLGTQLARSRSNTVFTINLIEGLPSLSRAVDMDYVCWEIDPSISPYWSMDPEQTDRTRLYTYRKQNVQRLEKVGYRQVEYLPLASNCRLRCPLPSDDCEPYRADVSFVGSSMKENALRQLRRLETFLQTDDRDWNPVEERLHVWKQNRPDWKSRPLQAVQKLLERHDVPDQIDLDGELVSLSWMIGEYRAYQKRQDVIRTVSEHFKTEIWGDPGWESAVGKKGNYRGPAGHGRELTRIYNASRVNLDVNRIYQPEIITMRVFDVMACGSVVLTEANESVRECFQPGTDCELYFDRDDLLETVEMLLTNPARREDIAENARQTIENRHSISNRLRTMGLLS